MALSDMVNNLNMQAANDWVNQQKQKKDEEEWAKQKEEERRVERVKEKSSSKKVSGAAKQVQQAVTQTTAQPAQQKSTGLQKIETPASSSSLSYSGTSSNFSESQKIAAEQQARQAEAERKAAEEQAAREAAAAKAAQEQAAREAAAREAERQRQEQLAARQAEKQRQREMAAAQAAQEQAAKEAAAQLSYNGAGASPRTRELEAQWGISKESESETTSKPRRSGEYRAEAQAPVVYTPQSTTTAMTTAARTTAANTKAALTGEESGLSEEQLAWLQTPEGQAALANQQAKAANDTAIRKAALNTGITFQGQPILQDKRISGQPMSTEEEARLAAVNSSIAAAEAARNYRDGTPGGQRYVPAATNTGAGLIYGGAAQPAAGSGAIRETGLPNPQVINRNQEAGAGVNAPSFTEALRGSVQEALNDFLASRMGGTPGGITADQAAYINDPNTGPQLPESQTPSFGDVIRGLFSGEQPDVIKRPASIGKTERQQAFEDALANGEITEIVPEGGYLIPGTNTYSYGPGGKTTVNNSRPGVDAALQEIMEKANAAGLTFGGANQPGATGNTVSGKPTKVQTGNENGIISGTGTKGSSGKEGVSNSEKTKGKNVYFRPSYGQAMDKGVKLPYKAGGYTEKELRDAGNIDAGKWKDTDKNFYEGYYLWNGKYYPVDQEKAAYYIANHNSYKGWEEPMREYYQTFGTYYGYRPDWKTAGGKNTWKANNKVWENYRPAKNSGGSNSYSSNNLSYSPASSSASTSGRSYGRGSTANNGMYWNGLTSWNA